MPYQVTLRKFSDEGVHGGQDKTNTYRLTRDWEELFRSSTAEYYEKVAYQDLSEHSPEEYIERVCEFRMNSHS